MGTFHHFKELDKAGVGEKLVKFKQDVLNALASDGNVRDVLAFVTKGGSCTGHSISWAVGRAKSKPNFSDNYSRTMKGRTETTFATGMRIQSAFRHTNKTGFVDALPKFFKNNDYDVKTERITLEDNQTDVGAALLATAGALRRGEAAILAYFIGETNSAHAIAMHKDASGTIFFFDPNVGEYKVLNADKFFSAYETICKNVFQVKNLETCSFRIASDED